ncbi:MAG: SDR family oxidoreductase, partial [Vulcanimicrobiota bacterium]
LMCRYIYPHMKKKKDGFILNISSGAGKNGIPNMAGYCASKFAVAGFSEALALEAKPNDVRVSVLYPGSINTGFHEKIGAEPPNQKKQAMMQPEDIAGTVYHTVIQPRRYWVFEIVMRAFYMGR